MSERTTERDLVLAYRTAKHNLDAAKDAQKFAQEEFDKAESVLVEWLDANSAEATARYEGLGYVSAQKPRLYASCRKENEENLFAFLKKEQREDLIRTTVSPQQLSAFVRERIEAGDPIPDIITYYLKPSLRLYA